RVVSRGLVMQSIGFRARSGTSWGRPVGMALSWTAALLVACHSEGCRNRGSAAQIAQCERLCTQLVTPVGCGGLEGTDSLVERCSVACGEGAEQALTAGCEQAHTGYLQCLSRQSESCSESDRSAASKLESAPARSSCAREFDRLARCRSVCDEAAVVYTKTGRVTVNGVDRDLSGEAVGLGCGSREPQNARRAPAGARCEHHSVCSRERCTCPGRRLGFLARACVDGQCADRKQACEWVPKLLPQYGCGGPTLP
ncbi:MAG TPA: hypothetical protein VFQ61_00495, partial [Polyangiaceae bacterium]|nr:hypothetical protein [Polyangiaceae bacterium]